jgi:hypothetical protein
MPDALDMLLDRGGATEPDPIFRAELMARVRAELAASDVNIAPDAFVAFGESKADARSRGRRTLVMRSAAAMVALAALAAIAWFGIRDRTTEPPAQQPSTVPAATPAPPTTLDDRALDPLSGQVFAIKAGADGALYDIIPFAVTEGGVRAVPSTSPFDFGPATDQQVVDMYAGLGGFDTVTCCDPDGVGTVWSHTDVLGAGSVLDHVEAGNARAFADPVAGTVNLNGSAVDAPGVVDVAIASDNWAEILIGGDAPRLLTYYSEDGSSWQLDSGFDVPVGACRVVALGIDAVVFSGPPSGDGTTCAADHGTAYESGQVMTEFDLPEPVTNIDSDHNSLMVAITASGDLLVGTLNPQPHWYPIAQGDYQAADVWAQ